MKRTKGLNVLRSALDELNGEIFNSIIKEYLRIGYTVDVKKLVSAVRNADIHEFFEEMGMNEASDILFEADCYPTESEDQIEFFKALIADSEISSATLIKLLAYLKQIDGSNGEKPSVLIPMDDVMAFEGDDPDNWICDCGNHSGADGFYPCDADGNLIEPVESSGWDGLHRCERCGRVVDQDSHQVTGRNLNPDREEAKDEN